MANTYYVGTGGNDSNNGTTWALRKLTLNGAEDIPVEAGDTVYVGAGTYRETLTCDVDGSSGSPITYIGDYDGSHTDGTGGVVRITGSDDDQSAARNNCIAMNGKAYRTFSGFLIDGSKSATYGAIWIQGYDVDHLTISNCLFLSGGYSAILCYQTANATNLLVENCVGYSLNNFYSDNEIQDDSGNVFQNILVFSITGTFIDTKSGGTTVKNCSWYGANKGVYVSTTLNSGQTVTVNNCIGFTTNYSLHAITLGNLVEDYNQVSSRLNVATGANSKSYINLFDTRWFFEMVNGGSMLTSFDLASYSKLINVAGTSPTTADMRGTTVQGTQREWGALEYDSTLDIEAGSGTGTSSVKILPFTGKVGL